MKKYVFRALAISALSVLGAVNLGCEDNESSNADNAKGKAPEGASKSYEEMFKTNPAQGKGKVANPYEQSGSYPGAAKTPKAK